MKWKPYSLRSALNWFSMVLWDNTPQPKVEADLYEDYVKFKSGPRATPPPKGFFPYIAWVLKRAYYAQVDPLDKPGTVKSRYYIIRRNGVQVGQWYGYKPGEGNFSSYSVGSTEWFKYKFHQVYEKVFIEPLQFLKRVDNWLFYYIPGYSMFKAVMFYFSFSLILSFCFMFSTRILLFFSKFLYRKF